TTTYIKKTIKEPTCSSEGVYGYFCSQCGTRLMTSDGAPSDTGLIPTTNHIPGDKVTSGVTNVAPTCTKSGLQYFECKDCHQVIKTAVVQPAAHTVDLASIYWNDSASAWFATCSVCKTQFNVSAAKTSCTCEAKYGTSFAKLIYSKATTCGSDGYSVYKCSTCGVSWIETDKAASSSHIWSAWVTITSPTCTTSGIKTHTCAICGDTETDTIAPLGHNPGYNQTVITPSTCVTKGVASSVCTRCGLEIQVSIPLAEHKYDEGVITLKPTCIASGIKTYTCSVCNTQKTETIAADPDAHEYGNYTVTEEATCVSEGKKAHTCIYCNHTETETVPSSGHTWGAEETKGKVTTKTCLVCKTVWSMKKTSKATTLAITYDSMFTLNINDSVTANKDIGFIVKKDTQFEEDNKEFLNACFDNADKKYDADLYGAYKVVIKEGENDIAATTGMGITIDLGKDYAKKEFLVKYLDGNTINDVQAERDGSALIIKGEDFSKFADKTFFIMTTNKKASSGGSVIIPIIICVVIIAVAGVAVVFVLKQKNEKNDII
ncbi:MAG: hypothetical protein ACI4QR_01075, partial [Eubacteriales bacterium]